MRRQGFRKTHSTKWLALSQSYSQSRLHSVTIQKVLCTFCLNGVGSLAEAFDSGEDVVGALGPSEGLGIGAVGVEVGCVGRLQFRGRPVCAAPDLIVGDQAKEALDLIDPDLPPESSLNLT